MPDKPVTAVDSSDAQLLLSANPTVFAHDCNVSFALGVVTFSFIELRETAKVEVARVALPVRGVEALANSLESLKAAVVMARQQPEGSA